MGFQQFFSPRDRYLVQMRAQFVKARHDLAKEVAGKACGDVGIRLQVQ
jgi:hypothetical protein